MHTFDTLNPDHQERVKIQIAQNAGIVIKQGERLIELLDKFYYNRVEKIGPEVDYKKDSLAGEVYLFLLASNQLVKHLSKNESPDCFVLQPTILKDIRIVRNIWEHQADFVLSGEDFFSRLKPENQVWLEERFPNEHHKVFQISTAPFLYSIANCIDPLKVLREARSWWDLVF